LQKYLFFAFNTTIYSLKFKIFIALFFLFLLLFVTILLLFVLFVSIFLLFALFIANFFFLVLLVIDFFLLLLYNCFNRFIFLLICNKLDRLLYIYYFSRVFATREHLADAFDAIGLNFVLLHKSS